MLRCCVLDSGSDWEFHISLAEFVYNNIYQASSGMAPFEALYGRPCRSPLCWEGAGESYLVGPDIVQDTSDSVADIRRRFIEVIDEGIRIVRRNLQAAQSHQKKYADIHRTDLEFQVGDYVYLRVAARKGLQKVSRLGKLAPRYVGPFKIISRVGSRVDTAADEPDLPPQRPVAYELDLPPH